MAKMTGRWPAAPAIAGIVALAALGLAACDGSSASAAGSVSARETILPKVEAAYGQISADEASFRQAVSRCTGDNTYKCVIKLELVLNLQYVEFSHALEAIRMPSGAPAAAASRLVASTDQTVQDFKLIVTATSMKQYVRLVDGTGVLAQANQIVTGYGALIKALRRM
jgi:hypothetical protein